MITCLQKIWTVCFWETPVKYAIIRPLLVTGWGENAFLGLECIYSTTCCLIPVLSSGGSLGKVSCIHAATLFCFPDFAVLRGPALPRDFQFSTGLLTPHFQGQFPDLCFPPCYESSSLQYLCSYGILKSRGEVLAEASEILLGENSGTQVQKFTS